MLEHRSLDMAEGQNPQPQTHRRATSRSRGLPGHWLWGHLPNFSSDPVGSLQQAAAYGRVPRLRFINNIAWLAVHPDDVKHVLVDNHANYIKGYGLQALKPVLGEGLLTSEDPLHKRERRLIQPAFHRRRIETYASIMSRYTGEQIARWQSGQRMDLHEEMMHLTMQIVAKTLFDADVSDRSDNLGQAISDLVNGFRTDRIGPLGQFLARFDRAAIRERNRNLAIIDAMIHELIRNRRAEGLDHGDLLSMILQATDSEASEGASASDLPAISDKLARDELFTLFVAGHETTAVGLTWAFYLLAHHSEIAARLEQELDAVLGPPGPDARLPGLDDLESLPYARQVFAEALRLYPPAYATARIAKAADRLGEGDE